MAEASKCNEDADTVKSKDDGHVVSGTPHTAAADSTTKPASEVLGNTNSVENQNPAVEMTINIESNESSGSVTELPGTTNSSEAPSSFVEIPDTSNSNQHPQSTTEHPGSAVDIPGTLNSNGVSGSSIDIQATANSNEYVQSATDMVEAMNSTKFPEHAIDTSSTSNSTRPPESAGDIPCVTKSIELPESTSNQVKDVAQENAPTGSSGNALNNSRISPSTPKLSRSMFDTVKDKAPGQMLAMQGDLLQRFKAKQPQQAPSLPSDETDGTPRNERQANDQYEDDTEAANFAKLKNWNEQGMHENTRPDDEPEFWACQEEQVCITNNPHGEESDGLSSPKEDDNLFVQSDDEQDFITSHKKRGYKRKTDGGNQTSAPKPKKVVKRNRPAAKGVNNRAAKGKGKEKLEKLGKKIAGRATKKGPLMSDIFEDTAATADLQDQPAFDSGHTRRPDALDEIIASLPEEDKKQAITDKNRLNSAAAAFSGFGEIKPADGANWILKGMKTPLKHYQVIGTALMRLREGNPACGGGGILADQMGLGKTIQMLANIVNGRPSPDSMTHATLIVAGPAIMGQWYAEIRAHCQNRKDNPKYGIGKVRIYKSRKTDEEDVNDDLHGCFMVLTTYQEVIKACINFETIGESSLLN